MAAKPKEEDFRVTRGHGIPIEGFTPNEVVDQGYEVPDFVPPELEAVQPVRTDFWVAKIEKFLKEQVWFQLPHDQYDAVITELKKKL